MGQYHIPVCIEAEEGLSPHTLGVGLKEGEQGFSIPSTPNAMVALVCARGGNMPADCSQSPIIGKWAGMRVLVVGDYAEDNDIPGWKGPRLSKLYHAMTPVEERKPKRNWRTIPLFTDISREARDFLEAVCNVRYFEQEQTCRNMVPGSKTYGQITVSLRGGPPFLNRLDRRGLDFDFRRGDEKCPQVWLWAQVWKSGGVTGHGLRV